MSRVKKAVAAVLAIVLCFSCMAVMSACRTKDETVLTFKNGDKSFEIKSGVYLCNLLGAYSDFRSEYGDALQKASQTTAAATVDYEKQTLDKKDYTTWIKDKCYDLCAQYAYVETEFDKLGLTLSSDQTSYAEQYASYYWATGYQSVYEANGVSYATYKNYFLNQNYKTSAIFNYYYGSFTADEKKKDSVKGSLRPSDADIKTQLYKDYVIADTLKTSLTKTDSNSSSVTSLTDAEKTAAKKKLQGYADRFNKGESFATIYKEFNGSDLSDSDSASGGKAKDKYATVYGSSNTSSSSDYFENIQKQTVGKAVVLEFSDQYMMIVKQDMTKDSYYFDTYKETVVQSIKSDEFNKKIETEAAKLTAEKNQSAVNYYTPQKVRIDTGTTTAANVSAAS